MFGGKRKKAENLVASGARGVGTIVGIRDTGMMINNNPRIDMVFQIEPVDGSAAFQTTKRSTVSHVAIPRVGERYPVYYDPENTGEFVFVREIDATGVQTILSQFGAAFGPDASGIGQPAPVTAPAAAAPADPIEQLARLDALRTSGALTDEEFATQKARVLAAT